MFNLLEPSAFFDCLAITIRLQDRLGNANIDEVYLFAYLSCLLSLYRGNPVSEWNYSFATTSSGHLYSAELNRAIIAAIRRGFLIEKYEHVQADNIGIEQYSKLKKLRGIALRDEYIDAACSTLLAIPIEVIRSSLIQEPQLKTAITLKDARLLLTEDSPGMRMLHEQFQVLSAEVGVKVENLMIPGVIWLTFLSKLSISKEDLNY